MENTKKILSFDAETNGLWGQAFAIGAVLVDQDGEELARFVGRCPIEEEVNEWVEANVLPELASVAETHASYDDLLQDFMSWRATHKEGAVELLHMGMPVEARLFADAHAKGIIGDWDGPYGLVDVAALPEVGDSVDGYNSRNGVVVDPADYEGGTHNPLYDSAAAAKCYLHWLANYKSNVE